jgi:enediyne polyketide synthase
MNEPCQDHGIAVVGMACIYPGSNSPEELWRNVLAGRRYFRKIPPERLPLSEYFDSDPTAPEKTYSDQMALITGWKFNPLEFKIPPITAEASDISHWLALSTAKSAIRESGILESVDPARVGVILGNSLTGEFSRSQSLRFRWPYVERSLRKALADSGLPNDAAESVMKKMEHFYKSPLPQITEDTLPGNMSNTIAGRICGYFNLGGGGFTIDGACSSSLLALAQACNALVNGDLDAVVAGGVDVSLDPFEVVGFAKARALASAGDDIRPYDRLAAGMLPGEGCGIIVLMREEDAKMKGHRVHALIKGWGYSSDGQGSITAPEQKGQLRALRKTYERAGYSISSVGLIEGHGTGTTLGDRVEIESLKALIDESRGEEICWVGSIKGNIGHTKSASGMAGFIKAVMALKRKIIPPTLNCREPNEAFGRPLGRLRPSVRGSAWAKRNIPRRAGVSAMGFGGSNAHITMEEINPEDPPSPEDLALIGSDRETELILFSADGIPDLRKRIEDLLQVARKICRAELTDLAAHLARNENKKEFRVAIIARSPWELAEKLDQLLRKMPESQVMDMLDEPEAGIYAGKAIENPKMAALFPGQGSQYLNMGEYLLRHYPFVKQLYLNSDRMLGDMLPRGLRSYIFMNTFSCKKGIPEFAKGRLKDTQIAQPAIVVSSVAALGMMDFLGLKPDIMLGHSLGQVTALHAAGVFDGATAIRIAALRGRAMASAASEDHGAMLAINESPDRVEELIQPFEGPLAISNYNSRRQTVVSGSTEGIKKLIEMCARENIRCRALDVSHAFHSDFVAPAARMFRHAVDSISFERISGRVISTLTGEEIGPDVDLKDHLAEHIQKPVRFTDAVLRVAEEKPDLWVEVGPKGVLVGLVRDILGNQADLFTTDLEKEDGSFVWNRLLARAFVLGFPVRTERLFSHRFHLPFDLESYNPEFIINPCERNVAGPDAPARNQLPEKGLKTKDHEDALRPLKKDVNDKKDMAEFAREWISKRTGLPFPEVLPEKRLRDDLGLDSIKAGELIIALSRKFGVAFKGDPTDFGNARFSSIIDAAQSPGEKEGEIIPVRERNKDAPPDVIRTFSMAPVPAPPDEDSANPLPDGSSVLIISEPESGLAKETALLLNRKGHKIFLEDLPLIEQFPKDLSALIMILSEERKSFFECNEEEFISRVEGMASKLFLLLKDVLANQGDGLRITILREAPEQDRAVDLDGGTGFLKTLSLEYPEIPFKWLKLPSSWPYSKKAELVIKETESSSPRIFYEYKDNGARLTRAATGIPKPDEAGFVLGEGDVLLATGGAKGITFELARGIARKTGVKLALAGSSPEQDEEVSRNLGALKEEGIPCLYIKCDVTEAKAVRKAIFEIKARLGTVRGVLHGAGVSRLSPFMRMDLKDFLRSIRIKAGGLHNILLALDTQELRALHVISSILGKTGMKGQADYTFANAWLDHAVIALKNRFPNIQCLSIGYSIWKETGLGKKLGAVESLSKIGISAIGTEEGVASYLELASRRDQNPVFAVTGRLTPELERNFYKPPSPQRGRYLERTLRYIPGGELLAEAVISYEKDLYIREHVFQGTPVFPGVMAIEAISQAAMNCMGSSELPVLRSVKFHRPIIIPEDADLRIRIQAVADMPENNITRVKVTVRSEADGFKDDQYSAECLFGLNDSQAYPFPYPLPERLWINPEAFVPDPLFQGKFFRRISSIRFLDRDSENITDVSVPEEEKYFSTEEMPLLTPSPAARDAFLQSGALSLPFGYLPLEIEEIRFHKKLSPGSEVICRVKGREEKNARYRADISVFDMKGNLLETMKGILLARADGGKEDRAGIKTSELRASLKKILPDVPLSIAITADPISRHGGQFPFKKEQNVSVKKAPAESVACVREAALDFACKHLRMDIDPSRADISYRADGKPELAFESTSCTDSFKGFDVSLSDTENMRIAAIAPAPAGIDIEAVEHRDAELWRGLLGEDGYSLAESLGSKPEDFDSRATLVWTLIEAGKKANSLKRTLPLLRTKLRGWLVFEAKTETAPFVFFSAFIEEAGKKLALSLAMKSSCLVNSRMQSPVKTSPDKELDKILRGFLEKIEKAETLWKADGIGVSASEEHHREFEAAVVSAMERLRELEPMLPADRLLEKQLWMQRAVLPLAGQSVVFRRASEKPLGYAGDFLLLDMMFRNELAAGGIGYHFDRYFLSYPGSRAVRERSFWVIKRIERILEAKNLKQISLMDLGCGPLSVERTLLKNSPEDVHFRITGIDYDRRALDFAAENLRAPNAVFTPRRENLVSTEGLYAVRTEAHAADMCMCMGLIEYLEDDTVLAILESLFKGARAGTRIFTANYVPGHHSRTAMEWLLDWRLVYRTEEKMRGLAIKAGFKGEKILTNLDRTGSIVLMELET